jgi:hypothetical protein
MSRFIKMIKSLAHTIKVVTLIWGFNVFKSIFESKVFYTKY